MVMTFREQFETAITEFNQGMFFECHDTLEDLWMDERGERKIFLQGLIQSAVGIFHATRGNSTGAESQLVRGLQKLNGYPEHYLGVDVATFRLCVDNFRKNLLERVALGEAGYNSDLLPRIEYRYDASNMYDGQPGE